MTSKDIPSNLLLECAERAIAEAGYAIEKRRSKLWNINNRGETALATVKTSRDRDVAFAPYNNGTGFKTLDDVDYVVVATIDDTDTPEHVEIYLFPAEEVRQRFHATYQARRMAGHRAIEDNVSMWLALDRGKYKSDTAGVGSGIVEDYPPIATYPLDEIAVDQDEEKDEKISHAPSLQTRASNRVGKEFTSIPALKKWTHQQATKIAGVSGENVDVQIFIHY